MQCSTHSTRLTMQARMDSLTDEAVRLRAQLARVEEMPSADTRRRIADLQGGVEEEERAALWQPEDSTGGVGDDEGAVGIAERLSNLVRCHLSTLLNFLTIDSKHEEFECRKDKKIKQQ